MKIVHPVLGTTDFASQSINWQSYKLFGIVPVIISDFKILMYSNGCCTVFFLLKGSRDL